MGIVKGFTDIIAPQNLAINGNFKINQRNQFTSGLTPAKVGDFISDCWQVWGTTNVDYLECHNDAAIYKGFIRCKGYGKKGQIIYLYGNVGGSHLSPAAISLYQNVYMTSAAVFKNNGGVPIQPRVYTCRMAGSTNIFHKMKTISPFEEFEPVDIQQNLTSNTSVNTASSIFAYLMADGEFDFYIYDYRTFHGAFINPPKNIQLPISDDLLRCKRYYQKIDISESSVGADDGTYYEKVILCNLPVQMAGTPTAVVSNAWVKEEGSDTEIPDTPYTWYVGLASNYMSLRAYKVIGGNKPSQIHANIELSV